MMMPERDWTDRPLSEGASLEVAGLTITRAAAKPACLISGNLNAALAAVAPDAAMVGLFAERRGKDAVRIARDRALCVGFEGVAGWHTNFAVSPATGLYARFDLSGPALHDALAEGTSADLAQSSASAATLFAGQTCLLTRRSHTAELWVEAAMATYMTSWFAGRQ